MKHSVIMPVYNAEQTLSLALTCLLERLPENAEIIVVDDGSADASVAIAQSFPVRLVQQDVNQGPSAARNRGAREATGDNLIFVDSDVQVLEGSLQAMLERLESDPSILGVNGRPDAKIPYPDWASNYVNLSLVYQLSQHGERVNTCFTSLCVLRRSVWEKMGGWDEGQLGRYVDDVQTRWFLPDGSIFQDASARFIHHKKVRWRGLFRHRCNVGFHFWRGIPKEEQKQNKGLGNLIIHLRYPLNTVLALLCLLIPIVPWIMVVIGSGVVINNTGLFLFTLRHQSAVRALSVFPVSLVEGVAFLLGIGWGGLAKYVQE